MGILLLSLLATTAVVFSGVYLLFRKYRPDTNPFSNILYWVTTIIATPVIYIGLIFLWLSASSNYETQVFDKESWAENMDSRYVYVDDLIDNEKLIGLTKSDLESMLGEADYEDDTLMSFYIGYTPKPFFNMDPDWLETDLIDGKVSHAYIRQ